LNFLILAFVIFQMVRLMNRMRNGFNRKEAEASAELAAAAPTPEDVLLLREIRDSLKSR
jgi:large conductance mechanosensitive channel